MNQQEHDSTSAPKDPLTEAMARVEPLPPERDEERFQPLPEQRPIIETRETGEARQTALDGLAVPFINAYLDLRFEGTGSHRFDARSLVEMRVLHGMIERSFKQGVRP